MDPYFELGMDKKVIVPYPDYLEAMKPDFDYVGDKGEIKDLVRCLHLPNANSVKVVGRRGVGVTALFDGLTQHQNSDFMPDEFMIRPIFKLNSSNLFNTSDDKASETRFKGALEELKTFAQQRKVKPFLIIDDGSDFVANAPQYMVNALIQAAIVADYVDLIIGVDEKKEKDFDEKHPEFRASFTTKKLDEPKKDQILAVLRNRAKSYVDKGVDISDDTLSHIVEITERFKGLYNTVQPNRSMRLLDSSATAFRLEIHSRPPGIRAKEETLEMLMLEKESAESDAEQESIAGRIEALELEISQSQAEWDEHRGRIKSKQDTIRKFDRLIAEADVQINAYNEETKQQNEEIIRKHLEALPDGHEDFKGQRKNDIMALDRDGLLKFAEFDLKLQQNPKVRELKKERSDYSTNVVALQGELEELSAEMHIQEEMPSSYVDAIASAETGTPVNGMSGEVYQNIKNAVPLLQKTVFGQDRVIGKISTALRRQAAGLGDPNRPLGNYLVLGPPGNGKTYTGEQIAEQIFGSSEYCSTIPMQSYMEKHTVSRLLSAPPGYAGYEDTALLVEIAQKMPFGVLILDEIEKAHPDIRQALLRIMDKGEFEALNGDRADFRNIVLYSTSNYGQDIWLEHEDDFDTAETMIMKRIRQDVTIFSPEYLDRHDEILCTGPLDLSALTNIAKKEVRALQASVAKTGMKIDISEDDIRAYSGENFLRKSGRHTKRVIRSIIGEPIADIKLDNPKASGILTGRLNDRGEFVFDYQKEAPVPAADLIATNAPDAKSSFDALRPGG